MQWMENKKIILGLRTMACFAYKIRIYHNKFCVDSLLIHPCDDITGVLRVVGWTKTTLK